MKKQQAVRMEMWVGVLALIVGALVMGTAVASPVPAVVGDWSGSLNTGGGSLRLVIHIASDKDGKLTATMDSPDQGATGIEVTSVSFKNPDLHFEVARIGGSYDGKANENNSEITGNWKQGSASLPLVLKRVSK
jgi:hypothetical protein